MNVYLSKLRKALTRGGIDPISTGSGAYRLHVEVEDIDAGRMQVLVASARELAATGELENAAERFREALSLWRGPTLAGLLPESLGRDEVAQLDELRVATLMDRIDCDLALGCQEQVLGELNVLVREHPLRERLRAQQMLALYRAGRQADALDAYGEARRTLVDDLGIEPSPALQRLQQAILRHDASLETPAGTAAVNGVAPAEAAPPPTPAVRPEELRLRRLRPRRWQLALAALAALVILAASVAAAIVSGSAGGSPHVVPNSLVRLDPRSGKPTLVVPVGVEPEPIIHADRDLELELRRSHRLPLRPPHASSADARRFPASALRRRRRHGRERLGLEQDADRDAARSRRRRNLVGAAVPVEDGDDPCPRSGRRPRGARSGLRVGDRRSLDNPRRGRPALTDRHAERSCCLLDAAWPKHHDDRLRVRVDLDRNVRRQRELAGNHQRGFDQTRVDPSRAR